MPAPTFLQRSSSRRHFSGLSAAKLSHRFPHLPGNGLGFARCDLGALPPGVGQGHPNASPEGALVGNPSLDLCTPHPRREPTGNGAAITPCQNARKGHRVGQYHLVVNLSRKEFLDPDKLGCGLRARQQIASRAATPQALFILLLCSNGRGGGDLLRHHQGDVIGRWRGDSIAVVGDYAENGDLPAKFKAETLYERCRAGQFTDVTDLVAPILKAELAEVLS